MRNDVTIQSTIIASLIMTATSVGPVSAWEYLTLTETYTLTYESSTHCRVMLDSWVIARPHEYSTIVKER